MRGTTATIDNRWRTLLSLIGGAITISSIAGQLSGYFGFIGNVNEIVDAFITSFIPISLDVVITLKIAIATLLVWVLFYLGLRQYSKRYMGCDLESWIDQVKHFLTVNTKERRPKTWKTNLLLFLLVPIKALFMAVMPTWPGKRIFTVGGLHVHLWKLLPEVFFLHAIAVGTVMLVYLGFNILKPLWPLL
jgi:hypothetical protein